MSELPPFHLAFPVDDLQAARDFYVRVLGCREGRSDETWIDFDLYGHQIVAHLAPGSGAPRTRNPVDGHDVPVPHFGVVLRWDDFHALTERLRRSGAVLESGPYVRFAGRPGEQATLFLLDPAGNALEFKSYRDPTRLFARD